MRGRLLADLGVELKNGSGGELAKAVYTPPPECGQTRSRRSSVRRDPTILDVLSANRTECPIHDAGLCLGGSITNPSRRKLMNILPIFGISVLMSFVSSGVAAIHHQQFAPPKYSSSPSRHPSQPFSWRSRVARSRIRVWVTMTSVALSRRSKRTVTSSEGSELSSICHV